MGGRGGGSGKMRVADYYLAQHLGICHSGEGAETTLLELKVGEKSAWVGSSTSSGAPVAGHDVEVHNPGLFGGNQKEGGVEGTMTVLHGGPSQLVPSKLASMIGRSQAHTPGYRGILSVFFSGLPGWARQGFKWSANNPYLKPTWFKVKCNHNRWYPEKSMIGDDANPMHIIRECIVNNDWGMGGSPAMFDDAEIRAVADQLMIEGFGLSMMWAQQSEIKPFIQDVLNHINGTLAINTRTGKFRIKLIRNDYVQSQLPTFTRDNVVIKSSQRKTWSETVNEINVTWTNPENEGPEVVTVQDPANISIQGGIVSDSRNYFGIRNRRLATEVAMREIQVASKALMQLDVEFDRTAYDLLPGDAILLKGMREISFEELVCRVVSIDKGGPGDMVIRASLVEDVFGQPAIYTTLDPGRWQSTAEPPVPITTYEVLTAPYFMVSRLLGETVAQGMAYPAVYPTVFAAPDGNDTQSYVQQARRRNVAGTDEFWQSSYDRIPVGWARLADAVPQAVESTVLLKDLKGRVYAEVGKYLYIGGQSGEIALITDVSGGGVKIRRGCLDTCPAQWPVDTPVWLVDDNRHGFDEELSSAGAALTYRLLPTTSIGQLPPASAPLISGGMSDRPHRPYPPANLRINGAIFPDNISAAPLEFTWSERNRILETSVILPWDAGSVPAEPGTTYTLEIDTYANGQWSDNAVVLRGAATTSLSVGADALTSNTTAIRYRLWSERMGMRSWTTIAGMFSIGDTGAGLPPGTGVEFGPPPAPVSATVEPHRNSIKITPQFAAAASFPCEFWRSRVPLKSDAIETEAFKAGVGITINDTGLAIDTIYFYYLRAKNDYGLSDWLPIEARTKIDPQEILDEMDGLIDSSKLTPELQSDLALLPTVSDVLAGFDPANIAALEAKAELAGQASLEDALKGHDEAAGRREAVAGVYRAQKVLADDAQALAQTVDRLDVKFEGKYGDAMAAIQDERTARATGDAALSEQISTTQASLNGLAATVQMHASAIVDLENGAQAMWSVKAQAGEITTGIGLIADQATGKSQVLVNASQFFVFDANVGKTAIFAIDQGQVIIRDAVIRKATIDILNSTEITATYIKANAALTSPVINGGQFNGGSLNIANRFLVDAAGNVTIRNNTVGGGMTVTNNRIDVVDTNGVLRVRIGYLL